MIASIVLLSAVALLIFLPRRAKDSDAILAPNNTNSSKAIPVFFKQAPGDLPAGRVLGKEIQITDGEKAGIEADLQEISRLCRTHYLQAEKIPSEYVGEESIRQEDIDAMEAALSSAGFCVINSDEVYPDYLENPEKLNRFWNDVAKGNDAETTVWNISSSGSVTCRVFQFAAGKGYCIHASGAWDNAGSLYLAYLEKKEILYWDMTPSGFLYQDIRLDRHWDAAQLLRAQSVDHDLYEWTEKYIAPIGYHNVNLFLLDWNSSGFGHVCFNDLLSQMYQMEHGDYLYARDYPYSDEPFSHSIIPADLFESVIYQHFNISLEEFRERALYDAENDAYPWQNLNGRNILYYPELIPEVTKVTENADGTVTLYVNVICPDKHTDHLFAHEVTMKIDTDGSFQYLSNRIVYHSETELPSPQARMEVQRFDVEDGVGIHQ